MRHRFGPSAIPLLLCLSAACAPASAQSAFTAPEDIRSAAMAALGGNDAQGEASVDPALRLARCTQPLQAVPNSARTVQVRCADAPGWKLYVPVRVRRERDVVVLTAAARAGEPIAAAQVAVQRRDMAAVDGSGFNDPGTVVGRTPLRALASGAVLTDANLVAGTPLRRGDPVVLLTRIDGIEVRVAGRALGAAAVGSVVAVENLESRRIVRGRLAVDSVVEVGR